MEKRQRYGNVLQFYGFVTHKAGSHSLISDSPRSQTNHRRRLTNNGAQSGSLRKVRTSESVRRVGPRLPVDRRENRRFLPDSGKSTLVKSP